MIHNTMSVLETKAGIQKSKKEIESSFTMGDYNDVDTGNLTSRQNGEMVKKMVEVYEQSLK
ncbi:alpha/beta-type small acid-soluble spore protein [Clostridium sp. HMP27]|uniref:alpha/beta-type small acid-soluble spore protein n=1 Tax=Clostridium sp. HMP27 TaxID=1487921 RepID=UPI00052D3DC9|nr:alpha/beta-type small acid-soluble spore protein [Clostridium sp. HMP27]KGK81487.1 hypothetical protein DP68_18310 [Clostridium sp. HMP27]